MTLRRIKAWYNPFKWRFIMTRTQWQQHLRSNDADDAHYNTDITQALNITDRESVVIVSVC